MKQNTKDISRFKDVGVVLTNRGRRYLERNWRRPATYDPKARDTVRGQVVLPLIELFEAKVIGTIS